MKRHDVTLTRGATLIELTCAIFVVGVGLFGGVDLYLRGIEKIRAVNEYETALCALNNELETLRALPWKELVPGEALPFRSSTPGVERLHLAETQATVTDADGLKELRVRIRWVGEHGRLITKELITLVACTDVAAHAAAQGEECTDDAQA